jgi:hypothetical protein
MNIFKAKRLHVLPDFCYFRLDPKMKRCFRTVSTSSRRRSIVGARQWNRASPWQHIVGSHPPNREASDDFITAFTIHRHQPIVLDSSTVMSCLILFFN